MPCTRDETFHAGPNNPLEFAVVGEVLPGQRFPGRVAPGQAVRIMTGAPVPEGLDGVLQAEAAEEVAGRLRTTTSVARGRHVSRRGEDIAAGRMFCRPGACSGPRMSGCSLPLARPPYPSSSVRPWP